MGHVPEFAPDFQCSTCREPYLLTGETPEARAEALAAWGGCCTQITPEAEATEVGEPVASGAPRLARFWTRFASWPFGAPDYTT